MVKKLSIILPKQERKPPSVKLLQDISGAKIPTQDRAVFQKLEFPKEYYDDDYYSQDCEDYTR